jgi:hypothetical protein
MAQKLYDIKFLVTNMTKIITNDNQLHSDWLQMTRFLVVDWDEHVHNLIFKSNCLQSWNRSYPLLAGIWVTSIIIYIIFVTI